MACSQLFILGAFLLMITVFHAGYVDAICDVCVGRNTSNITGPRWPEDVKKEESKLDFTKFYFIGEHVSKQTWIVYDRLPLLSTIHLIQSSRDL